MTQAVSEQAVLFGNANSLVGIFARPAAGCSEHRPTLVVLNTGIIHRVGHHRMFVTMSRIFGNAGYPVLRFDLSGIGDSDPRDDNLSPLDAAMSDIREALDWVEATSGARRIVLIGLCSGADHAVLYGHTDDRVAGLVLLDPTIPATLQHHLRYVAPRLVRMRSWIDAITFRSRTVRRWATLGLHYLQTGWLSPHPARLDFMDREGVESHYQRSVDNGIRMLAVLTGETTRQTYRKQMIEAFPHVRFGDWLRLEYLATSDHTFILESDRTWLTNLILQWLAADEPAAPTQ